MYITKESFPQQESQGPPAVWCKPQDEGCVVRQGGGAVGGHCCDESPPGVPVHCKIPHTVIMKYNEREGLDQFFLRKLAREKDRGKRETEEREFR